MRVNGFRCDVCCKEHLVDPTIIFQHYGELMPNDWFMLSKGRPEHGKEPLLFCSVACLLQWAEKQVIIAREADGPSSTDVAAFKEIADREYIKHLQELGQVPRNRLMQGNWLPGDEE